MPKTTFEKVIVLLLIAATASMAVITVLVLLKTSKIEKIAAEGKSLIARLGKVRESLGMAASSAPTDESMSKLKEIYDLVQEADITLKALVDAVRVNDVNSAEEILKYLKELIEEAEKEMNEYNTL